MAGNGEIIAAINTAVDGLRADVKKDIGTIHTRISDLARETVEFRVHFVDRLARLEEQERNCPIDVVVSELGTVKGALREDRGEKRYRAWVVGTGITIAGIVVAAAAIWAAKGG